MNKIMLSVLLSSTVMFSSVVGATEVKKPMMPPVEHMQMDKIHHGQMAKKMAEDLGLTQEQQEQAKKVREKGQEEIKPLMEEMKALREKIDAKRKANMEEFEKILTEDQKKKFGEMKGNSPFGKAKPHMFKGMHKAPKK